MKSFIFTALLAIATSALAASIPVTPTPAKWLSVETGVTKAGNTTTLAKRLGTEVVTCYNEGTTADRAPIVSVIDDWCNNHAIGTFVSSGETIWARYDYGTFTVLVSGEAINGCTFTVDGNCNRLLREPVDQCNTGGVNGKQGGFETDLCGQWRTDPGSNGSDY
ncbi:hypothetical protein BDZ97DRAFT_1825203 [Flammula alnicola]|nr:hypothetical protein BDZ97DRAFT_1857988 [Flammula alnicola]KAF8962490.1 hypothetical protein BDZ97DRAFT_1825203 [Flammula alnicola]